MAMDKSAADAFVYAKASGMLARSFVGDRAKTIFNSHSLAELWNLVLKTDLPSVPESLLAKELEKKSQAQFLSQFEGLIANYSVPPQIVSALIHFYEFDNLKQLGAALCLGETKIPELQESGSFKFLNYEQWPDIKKITAGTCLEWYDHIPKLSEQQVLDYKLDCQYVNQVWSAVKKIKSPCRNAVLDLIGEKIRMDNLIWAIRLKLYYGMSSEEIKEHLVWENSSHDKNDELADLALNILDWDLDNFEQWKNWKFKELLNPHTEGTPWTVDPRWIMNCYKNKYVHKAYRLFHLFPFTECPLICWYIVKRDELDNIRAAAEGLRLNINLTEVLNG